MNRAFTRSGFLTVIAVLTVALLASVAAFGQATSGDVVGTVYDKTGAVVANANVTATNEATGVKSTATANTHGEYHFINLIPGNYTLTASSANFNTTSISHFAVELNKTSTGNIVLEVGKITETVEVAAGLPPIDTTTAQVESIYTEKEAQDLPTASIGSGVLNLSLLQAGVASTGALGAGAGPSVGGQRPRNNNFTIEGLDNNDKGVTGPQLTIPNDAVQSFSILQNQFSPEFGHSTGGQFNTSVINGTNQFHGRLYEYFRNRNLNAVDPALKLQGLTNSRYDNNRFGGQIGGPIFKNKLFFFVNYEYNPIGQASTPAAANLAPTAGGYATLAALSNLNQTNISQLQKYAVAPAPCSATDISNGNCPGDQFVTINGVQVLNAMAGHVPINGGLAFGGTQAEIGILPIQAPNFTNNTTLVTSIDWTPNDKDQVRGRYIYNKTQTIDTAATLPIFYTPLRIPAHLASLSEYHAFTPLINNELRVGFHRLEQNFPVPNFTFPGLDQFPNITIFDLNGLNVGPDGNAPQFANQNFYSATDNLTWVKGNHSLKFGIEGRKYISPQKFIQRSRGDYQYNSLDAYVNDLTPDAFSERSFGTSGYSGDQYAIYGYVNDIYKVSNNLTLNLGLRYEYTSTPFGWTQQSLNSVANVPGLISFGSPQAPKKDFAPRVGFAYSPGTKGNTAIRGGFGLGYDVLYDNIGVLSRPPQFGSTVDCPGGIGCPASNFLASGGIPNTGQTGITILDQATARANTSSFLPNNVKYPYAIQWNIGIQHTFASNYTAEVRYVGTRGVHLNVQNRIDIIPVVTPTNFLPTYITAPSQATLDSLTTTLSNAAGTGLKDQFNNGGFIDPNFLNAGFFSNIVGFLPYGSSTYHGLSTQLNRRFSNGLQFQAAYTFSHNIDNSTADFFSTIVNPRRPQNFRDLRSERGNSALDHRHRLTVTTIYDAPWFQKSSNYFLRNLVGNIQFAPVYTYETGGFGSVQSGRDVNLNGDNAGDRVIINPAGIRGTGTDSTALPNTAGDVVAYVANDPTAYFIRGRSGALANSSRNTLSLRPINNFDITATKKFSFTERLKMEFGAQFFNLLNHPQFIPGSVNDVGQVGNTSARNYLIPGSSEFNKPQITFAGNARATQLYVKFVF